MFKIRNSKLKSILCVLALAALTSCASLFEDESLHVESNPELLYQEGVSNLSKRSYQAAIEKFEMIEREHPASDFAAEAQINRAYTQYLDGNYVITALTADEFVKQFPSHPSVPYMYYLKALCYYDRIVDVGRDQDLTYKAIDALNEVIARFPNTTYAKDAKVKMEYSLNNLAGKEMEIGRFYLKGNKLIAAVGRFKTVIDKYERSIFTPEALYRLAEIYYALGDLEQAEKYAAVLGHNYPSDDWYKRAYALMNDEDYNEEYSWFKKQLKKIW